ncbi:outer membrane chaperone skp (omph) [Flammeovirgaceae bacterium 311]|nr:outer membrane chaperone skp (omph) [Flammeovirgaceae bacterium 311]
MILNVVLLVAVAVLFYLHFAGAREVASVGGSTVQAGAPRAKTVIAYINSDSLLNNYEFFKDIEKELQLVEQKYTSEYTNRARGLESEIQTFQQTAQNMTMGQAKAREEELMRKQNNLMQYQQSLSQRLMQEQAKYQDSLYAEVRDYVKVYGEQNNLDVVLTYQKGSGVIYASDSLNITQDVIAGLNERYKQTKGNTAATNTGTTPKN